MTAKKYKIREGKDEGFGAFHLYCDGDWLETFHTETEAEAEMVARQQHDVGR